jgi:hypothetical protein
MGQGKKALERELDFRAGFWKGKGAEEKKKRKKKNQN